MNKRLPYEQQIEDQLVDLPLPDEDAAWEDMRQRLEEDDDRPVIPIWLRGCGLWGLIGIIILAISWWFIRPEKFWSKKQEVENISIKKQKETGGPDQNTNPGDPLANGTHDNSTKKNNQTSPADDNKVAGPGIISNNESDEEQDLKQKEKSIPQQNKKEINKKIKNRSKDKTAFTKKNIKNNRSTADQRQQDIGNETPVLATQEKTKKGISESEPKEESNRMGNIVQDSVPMKNNPMLTSDSINKPVTDSVKKKKKERIDTPGMAQEDSTESDKIFFSAGIGMLQTIPINGQELSPYSSVGRKNMWTDYIPSVYFQLNHPKRGFANIGFRYGAPQYNKEFTYAQDVVFDTSTQSTTTSSMILKKSFYHQVPLSFNFFVLPHWSVGGGAIWNKFYGAVADKSVSKNNGQTDSLLSKETVSFKTDSTSSFTKSYIQILLQTEYNWKRFYFGVRYAFGMEPYIRFTLPNGVSQKENNRTLQVFIRYDIWQSKKK